MNKYKDDKGHTIYLKTECSAIRAICPFCDKPKEFELTNNIEKTKEEKG